MADVYLFSHCESSHPIPRCWTFQNQFRPRNQFHQFWVLRNWLKPESVGIDGNSMRFRNYNFHYYCIISYPSSDDPIPVRNSGIEWNRNRSESVGISYDSRITTSIIIVPSRTHLVMIRFRSAIPELSETGIGRKRWESVGIPTNSVRFRNYNFHYYCIISYPSSDEGEGEGWG